MDLKRVIYCSKAAVPMSSLLNVASILAVSSRNNERDDISGLLAYAEGTFIQAIEGPVQAVGIANGPPSGRPSTQQHASDWNGSRHRSRIQCVDHGNPEGPAGTCRNVEGDNQRLRGPIWPGASNDAGFISLLPKQV
jgi:hypothetical protein